MYKIFVSSIMAAGVLIITSSFFQKYDLAKSIERGKEAYTLYCMSCHMVDGNGTPGVFPPLAKSDYLKKPVNLLITAVLEGQDGEIIINGTTYNALMPAQNYLTDEQIADVLNYVRNDWGNKNTIAVTPAQVKVLRK